MCTFLNLKVLQNHRRKLFEIDFHNQFGKRYRYGNSFCMMKSLLIGKQFLNSKACFYYFYICAVARAYLFDISKLKSPFFNHLFKKLPWVILFIRNSGSGMRKFKSPKLQEFTQNYLKLHTTYSIHRFQKHYLLEILHQIHSGY